MKWLGWIIAIFAGILLLLLLFLYPPLTFIIGLYGGLLAYWNFRENFNERWNAIKKIGVVGIIILTLLLIETIILRNLANVDITPVYYDSTGAVLQSSGFVSFIIAPSFIYATIPMLLFIAIPALLAFLEGLTPPDSDGLKRNPFFVLMIVILTFGVYVIYWFWQIKKGLRKSNIETTTLWWFLLPIVGWILVYVSFSQGLEKKTTVNFWVWFLIFFFFSGIDVVINQAIINHSLQKNIAVNRD